MRWQDAYERMKATAEAGAAQCERWASVTAELRAENERLREAVQLSSEEIVRLRAEKEASMVVLDARRVEVERLRAEKPVCTFAGLHSQVEELQREVERLRLHHQEHHDFA